PPARCRRGDRSHCHGARPARTGAAADRPSRHARSGLCRCRSPACRAPADSTRRALQFLRLWRQQRSARVPCRRPLNTTETAMSATATPETVSALLPEIAQLIVTALNLEMAPAEIEPDAPLFGDGLGLDSIDVLEIALVVSKRYGFQLRSDNEDNVRI